MDKKNLILTSLTIALIASLGTTIYAAYAAYTTWQASISWDVESTGFGVYDVATGGTELTSPYIEDEGILAPDTYTYTFYIENQGNVAITVTIENEVTVGCTASWSPVDPWYLSVTETRMTVTLTLTVIGSGHYDFDFESTATS